MLGKPGTIYILSLPFSYYFILRAIFTKLPKDLPSVASQVAGVTGLCLQAQLLLLNLFPSLPPLLPPSLSFCLGF